MLVEMHFSFLCKKNAELSNKFTIYKQKKKNILNLFFQTFPGDSQKIPQLFLNGIFNIVLLLDAILIDVT